MIDVNLIKDNTVLIIPNNIKSKVLDSFNGINKLLNVKIMDLNEVKKHNYFDYDVNTIIYLMNKYNYKYDVARNYIDNLYYLNDIIDDSKIKKLHDIKEELINNNLLYFDKLFLDYINNKNILVYGFDYINKFDRNMLNNFKNITIINKEYLNNKPNAYYFNTLNEEVEYVFYNIATLISNGVPINKIKLSGIDEEYLYSIRKFSKYYNIPVNIPTSSIYSSRIVQLFLNESKKSKDYSIGLNYIKDNYSLDNENNNYIFTSITNILNKYNLTLSFNKTYECICNDLKHKRYSNKSYSNCIDIIDINNNIIDEDEYLFLLGFNQNIFPKLYKDDDYISDNIKTNYLLETTKEKNTIEKNIVSNIIKTIKNITITYKLNSIKNEYYPSDLISELGLSVEEGHINNLITFSTDYDKLKCGITLDNLIKYGIKSDELNLYNSNYKIPYLTYDNRYTNIDQNKIINKYKEKGLILSYSHLDNYYHCAFKYYLNNILCIDKYEENFPQKLGTFFHYMLSICLKEDFDFDKEYSKYINNLELIPSEKFFINNLKKELEIIINRVKKLHNETGLTSSLFEQNIKINKDSIIPVTFKGIIDKIMYKEKDNTTYVSIIDYKTGFTEIDLKKVPVGLKLQLPTYLYLVSKSNLFKNIKFSGFYIQQILHSEVKIDNKKNYEDLKNSNLRLSGYSTDDLSRLEMFDPTYLNSDYIVGMKLTKDNNFTKNTKVISDIRIDNLIELVDKLINEARDNILKSNFTINPKEINGSLVGCDYCKYKDICYMTNKDIEKVNIPSDLSFLGGENND